MKSEPPQLVEKEEFGPTSLWIVGACAFSGAICFLISDITHAGIWIDYLALFVAIVGSIFSAVVGALSFVARRGSIMARRWQAGAVADLVEHEMRRRGQT